MPFELFHTRFPEIAEKETRVITVLESSEHSVFLPPGQYAFLEMFCNEPGCDCRRVFFIVTASPGENHEAVIAYGWESSKFYRTWYQQGTDEEIAMLKGPELNVGSPQGRHADAILQLFIDCLLPQTDYIERVKRHYRLFRSTVDRPRNPLLKRRRTGG